MNERVRVKVKDGCGVDVLVTVGDQVGVGLLVGEFVGVKVGVVARKPPAIKSKVIRIGIFISVQRCH